MRPPYYLTAYGIACKHGFEGTEEEWLNSLTAFYLARQAGYEGTAEEWLSILNDPVPAITIGVVATLEGGSDATVTITGDKYHPILNFGIPRGLGMVDALALVGGTMRGMIDMAGFGIIGVADPKNAQDAVNKKYADAIKSTAEKALPRGGGMMEGNIDMKGKQIKNLPDPTEDGDAVPKRIAVLSTGATMTGPLNVIVPTEQSHATNKGYVDTRRVSKVLAASGWSDAAPYTQSITVDDLTDQVFAKAYPDIPEDAAQEEALAEETPKVTSCKRSGKEMIFRCREEKPEKDIPIIVEVYV